MSETPTSPTPDELKAALKAFKKRLKLTRLDNESRLGGGPLTGRSSDIVGIQAESRSAPGARSARGSPRRTGARARR